MPSRLASARAGNKEMTSQWGAMESLGSRSQASLAEIGRICGWAQACATRKRREITIHMRVMYPLLLHDLKQAA